jgi:transcriptional regulator GlxA family with amidase domain
VLRRAISFMNANVRLPITVPDVAKEAGVSVRTLELAFRRYYGRTPLAHLRGLRLAGAHRELRRADPTTGVTVGDIASRWGYQTHSAFSAAYRRQFSRSPRQTLGE